MSKSKRSNDPKIRGREDLVRASPLLTDSTKLLWIELCRRWAWDDFNARPAQYSLAKSLTWSVRKVQRNLAILVSVALVKVERTLDHTSNTYVLPSTIPASVHPGLPGGTTRLTKPLDGFDQRIIEEKHPITALKDRAHDTFVKPKYKPADDTTRQSCRVVGDKVVGWHTTKLSCASYDEVSYDESCTLTKEKRAEASSLSSSQKSNTCSKMEQRSETNQKVTEASLTVNRKEASPPVGDLRVRSSDKTSLGLLDEIFADQEDSFAKSDQEASKTPKSRKIGRERERRSASADLVGSAAAGALSEASKEASGGLEMISATPRLLTTPQDVLELLSAEINLKYGSRLSRGIPLALEGKDSSAIRKTILTKYAPDVVIDMVRVLVWDWEVAREAFFPPQKQHRIPTVGDLVRYRAGLSSAIETGLDYEGGLAGNSRTYSETYLDSSQKLFDDDPF